MKTKKKQKSHAGKRAFLTFAILFFLLSVAGFSSAVLSVGLFCLLCGLACIAVYSKMKKSERAAKTIDNKKPTEAAAAKSAPVAASLASNFSFANNKDIEIIFPDGHSEQHNANEKINGDDCCLITENGRTYHNKIGCFCNWSDEYKRMFTNWRLIAVDDAKRMGLKRCKFCFGYEIAKEDCGAVVLSIFCAAQKYQDNMTLCSVGDRCEVEHDIDSEKYFIVSGDEIGYLTEKQVDACDIDIFHANIFIDEIIEQENGKYKVKIIAH